MARVAVDTCVGRDGVRLLKWFGHDVVVEAEEGEPDREWFHRAIDKGAQVIISADGDLEILCYDHRVDFFKARQGDRGHVTAQRFAHVYKSL